MIQPDSTSTLGYAVKRALIDVLTDAYAADPDTAGVQVQYAAFGLPERERVHGGAVRSEQNYPYVGNPAPRRTRNETGTVEIHLMVLWGGATVDETDARALQLGKVLEHAVASDPQLKDADGNRRVPGMSWCGVRELEGEYALADDADVISTLTYVIGYTGQIK